MTSDTSARTGSRGRKSGRREEILAATRALFDESGSRDTQIDEIARAVGVNRAILYRHFSSKEEIFAEVVVTYLGELRDDLSAVTALALEPEPTVGALSDAIIDFGLRHPAVVDCALMLLRRTGDDLMVEVGERSMARLGHAMWSCLEHVVRALDAGNASGVFRVDDTTLLANLYYTEALGILRFASLQVTVNDELELRGAAVEDIKRLARLSALGQARG